MKTIATLMLLTFLCRAVPAQEKPAPASPPPAAVEQSPRPSDEQQRAFAEAVRQTQEARSQAEAAQARLEASRAAAQGLLYRIMAKLRLDPDEWRAVMAADGRLGFEKIPKPDK
jgi:uncharacterized membrane protein